MAIAQEEHPAPPAMRWSWTSDAKCVRLARSQLRRYLADWDADSLTEFGTLLLSELLTNSVKHATCPRSREIETVFELSGSMLRIEVSDSSNHLPAMQHPGDTDENGRGLSLVAALSTRRGVAPRKVNGDYAIGKTVWFEIDRV